MRKYAKQHAIKNKVNLQKKEAATKKKESKMTQRERDEAEAEARREARESKAEHKTEHKSDTKLTEKEKNEINAPGYVRPEKTYTKQRLVSAKKVELNKADGWKVKDKEHVAIKTEDDLVLMEKEVTDNAYSDEDLDPKKRKALKEDQ